MNKKVKITISGKNYLKEREYITTLQYTTAELSNHWANIQCNL